jgi:hypothetical protein
MFREWFPEFDVRWLTVVAFLLSKIIILRDEGQGPSFISVHHFVYLLARWYTF